MGSLLTSGVALHYLYCVQSESALLRLNFWLGFALQEGVCVSVFETTCVNVSAPINSCVFCLFFSAQIFFSVLTEKAFKSQRKRFSFWTNCCPHSTFSRWASCLFFFFCFVLRTLTQHIFCSTLILFPITPTSPGIICQHRGFPLQVPDSLGRFAVSSADLQSAQPDSCHSQLQ